MATTPAPQSQSPVRLREIGKTQGFAFGFTHECAIGGLEIDPEVDFADMSNRLAEALAGQVARTANTNHTVEVPANAADAPAMQLVETIADLVARLQEAAGIPVVGASRVMSFKAAEGGQPAVVSLALPTFMPEAAANTLGFVAELTGAVTAGIAQYQIDVIVGKLLQDLERYSPQGTNTAHLLRAAVRLGIPYTGLPGSAFQLGWGRKARLFDSSATDATSLIGGSFAGNKLASTAMLREAGIPVPANRPALTLQEAQDAVEEIGMPVVVKPNDMELGAGVSVGVGSQEMLEKAFERANKASPDVIVEQQVAGREYRMLVVNGELFWAFERVPAGVTGDGSSTVRALVDKENAGRAEGPNQGLARMAIQYGDDTTQVLEAQGLTLESVPDTGRFVRLQAGPRVARGGAVLPVFDNVHPDNAEIACRAARLLRLDVAGIDFISPDISRSWREGAGYMIEVNAKPQFSPRSKPDIYDRFLEKFVEGQGRIPSAIVFGANASSIAAAVAETLGNAGKVVGVATPEKASVGQQDRMAGQVDPFAAIGTLLKEPLTDAVVLACDSPEAFGAGIPLDRVDLVVLADESELTPRARGALRSIGRHVTGDVVARTSHPAAGDLAKLLDGREPVNADSDEAIAAAICERLLARAN